MHFNHPQEAHRAVYVCPIVFDRNAHEIPALVRCADLMWAMAGISALVRPWPISIPTSVYSLPLLLAREVGGWDTDAGAIGEDMHMLLKCYFGSATGVVTRTVFSAASQCNISSGKTGFRGYIESLDARYRQALRHMWGSLDTGFALRRSATFPLSRIDLKHMALLHMLWEAHFLPVHFTLLLIFSAIYTVFMPTELMHPFIGWAFWFTSLLRTLSFIAMNVALLFYDRYHTISVEARVRDMESAALPDGFSFRHLLSVRFLADRLLFPVAGTIFGSIPAIQAEISHFWTDKLVYRVSVKPLFHLSA
jgi:hypothetical protein